MLTEAEHRAKMARIDELCMLDPSADTPEGIELMHLVEQVQEYERAKFPFVITKADIAQLRGGLPDKCDFCKKATPPEQLEPEEAGDWVCWACLERWAAEDGQVFEASFWARRLKEVQLKC